MTDDNKTIIKQSKSDWCLTASIGQFYQKIKQNWQLLTAGLFDKSIWNCQFWLLACLLATNNQ